MVGNPCVTTLCRRAGLVPESEDARYRRPANAQSARVKSSNAVAIMVNTLVQFSMLVLYRVHYPLLARGH